MATQPSDLRALACTWLDGRQRRGELNGRSSVVEAGRLSIFLRMYGDQAPDVLDRRALLDWQGEIGHLQPATRRSYTGAVGKFLRWLHAEGAVDVDLTAHLSKVRQPRHKPRALRSVDVARVIGTCPEPHPRYRVAVWLKPAAALMAGCGLRCCEISRLDLDDWDPHARTLFVRGKGGHERVVPVPDQAAAAVEDYLEQRGRRPGPLFQALGSKADPTGRLSAKWVSRRTGKLMAAAGVHQRAGDGRTAHALRHTCATDAYRRSRNLPVVQAVLGHRSLATTQIYLDVADLASMRDALEGRSYLSGLAPTGTDGPTIAAAGLCAEPGVGQRALPWPPTPRRGNNESCPSPFPNDDEHTGRAGLTAEDLTVPTPAGGTVAGVRGERTSSWRGRPSG